MSARGVKKPWFALVYQDGIANVFKVDFPTEKRERRGAVRLVQGSFSECENVIRGLRFADCHVAVFSCNRAGDILLFDWDTAEDDTPFRESTRYASLIGGVL